MLHKMHSDEWLEGHDASSEGQTEWESPYSPNSPEDRDWRSGWQYADFDERVSSAEANHANH